jgi:phosphoribosylanthranilate isomerase
VKDAQLAALAGADAVGLNFYDQSPRHVDLEEAERIVKVLPPRVTKVGVFVNALADDITRIAGQLRLDMVQLHGDEPPEMLARLTDRPVLRAFRVGENGVASIEQYLEQCAATHRPAAILVDASHGYLYGGTGKTVDWQSLAAQRARLQGLPLILAGGLTPFNVAEAIALVQPDAVDTASGVESEQGHKDPILVRAFVTSARRAFAALRGA